MPSRCKAQSYNGYKTSRKLVDTNTGVLALKASAKEVTSGEPVHGAIFTFSHESDKLSGSNGIGEITKKTTKKGNFHIKNMKAGTYKVFISKPGYEKNMCLCSLAQRNF
jgi:Prealbumin-like fold domain